jgi:hypothetical protein
VISKDIRDSGNPEYLMDAMDLMDAMNKIDTKRESRPTAVSFVRPYRPSRLYCPSRLSLSSPETFGVSG